MKANYMREKRWIDWVVAQVSKLNEDYISTESQPLARQQKRQRQKWIGGLHREGVFLTLKNKVVNCKCPVREILKRETEWLITASENLPICTRDVKAGRKDGNNECRRWGQAQRLSVILEMNVPGCLEMSLKWGLIVGSIVCCKNVDCVYKRCHDHWFSKQEHNNLMHFFNSYYS